VYPVVPLLRLGIAVARRHPVLGLPSVGHVLPTFPHYIRSEDRMMQCEIGALYRVHRV
jgi:hypothetical protein